MTAATTELDVNILSEIGKPEFTVEKERDPNGWFGRPVADSTRRQYTLLRLGVNFGEIKVLSPFIETPEPERREYFKAAVSRAIEDDARLRSA